MARIDRIAIMAAEQLPKLPYRRSRAGGRTVPDRPGAWVGLIAGEIYKPLIKMKISRREWRWLPS
jgi:hypothetical protein